MACRAPSFAAGRALARAPPVPSRLAAPRRHPAVRARSQGEHKDLLGALRGLDDAGLAAWAAEPANRERLSLSFMGWLSDEELSGSASEPDEQQALWELGSKLMALREGLAPVANDVLQAELRAAALRCAGIDSGPGSGGEEAGSGSGGQEGRRQDAQQPAAQSQQHQQREKLAGTAALVSPAFGSAVQATAALGLSPEGLVLFQQQAAALEAVVGTSRAKSLTEVIGRAKVEDVRQMQGLAEADAATRILDVLLSVQAREERAAMLQDAFTPPTSTAAVDDDASYFSPDEDQVFTTPIRLLQAIDLYLARLSGEGGSAARGARQIAGGALGMSPGQLQKTLRELREDVEAYSFSDSETC